MFLPTTVQEVNPEDEDSLLRSWATITAKGKTMFKRLLNTVCASLIISLFGGAKAETIVSSEYFPLADGNSWTFSADGSVTETGTVLPGTTLINGVATKALENLNGAIDYLTSDANGIRQHREFDPSPPATTATYSPPNVVAQGISNVPDVVNNSGTISRSVPDASPSPFVFNYTDTFMVEAFETITVPAGIFKTLRVQETLRIFGISQGVSLDDTIVNIIWVARHIGPVKEVSTDSEGTETSELISTNVTPPVFSAVLPSSRSVQVTTPATAFATIDNPSGATATACSISPVTNIPADFLYQTTDPLTNALIGTPNTPATIAPEASQSFVIAFTPTIAFDPTEVELQFNCTSTNMAAAPIIRGVNTLLLSASDTPTPDIIAIAATPSGDGIVHIPDVMGTGVFSIATANVGVIGIITASVDTGMISLPVSLSICETNPTTGDCISPIQSSIVTTIEATATFTVFVNGAGNVPLDPANNRIIIRFQDGSGITRGSTSVAVTTEQ